ncbi:hypothetical protein ACWOD8_12585 [Enterococcus plantarum]|uniref:hypothetical protein n=1 Tax=Enterococcus plantarum TaxID=1077675 RepID=UPI000B7164B5|nr:hypothetical protein [Enterococcus plantarum]OTP46790.1 hypothetical protein A5881_003768 [Enterococcus termitis]
MRKNKKNDSIPTGLESSRRTIEGLPGGDPNSGTTWKDTIVLAIVVIVAFILYVIFT